MSPACEVEGTNRVVACLRTDLVWKPIEIVPIEIVRQLDEFLPGTWEYHRDELVRIIQTQEALHPVAVNGQSHHSWRNPPRSQQVAGIVDSGCSLRGLRGAGAVSTVMYVSSFGRVYIEFREIVELNPTLKRWANTPFVCERTRWNQAISRRNIGSVPFTHVYAIARRAGRRRSPHANLVSFYGHLFESCLARHVRNAHSCGHAHLRPDNLVIQSEF